MARGHLHARNSPVLKVPACAFFDSRVHGETLQSREDERSACWGMSTRKKTSKQTNKPTNQQTNKTNTWTSKTNTPTPWSNKTNKPTQWSNKTNIAEDFWFAPFPTPRLIIGVPSDLRLRRPSGSLVCQHDAAAAVILLLWMEGWMKSTRTTLKP